MIDKLAYGYVSSFDNIFGSLFGCAPLSDTGMDIMIAFVSVCAIVNLGCYIKMKHDANG